MKSLQTGESADARGYITFFHLILLPIVVFGFLNYRTVNAVTINPGTAGHGLDLNHLIVTSVNPGVTGNGLDLNHATQNVGINSGITGHGNDYGTSNTFKDSASGGNTREQHILALETQSLPAVYNQKTTASDVKTAAITATPALPKTGGGGRAKRKYRPSRQSRGVIKELAPIVQTRGGAPRY